MTEKINETAGADREMVITRMIDAPRERVFEGETLRSW